jgi:hypothetical protein
VSGSRENMHFLSYKSVEQSVDIVLNNN